MVKTKSKPNLSIIEVTTERQIVEVQLERLRSIALERMLSYEEIKIFDLLTKNLLLIKGEATTITGVSSRLEIEAISEATLIELAQAIDKDIINKSLEMIDADDSKSE